MNLLLALSLILLVDVSGSVDSREYAIQKDGVVAALNDKAVQQSIYNQRGICLAYVEFHSSHHIVVPWMRIETADDARIFATLVAAAGRHGSGSTNVYGAVMGAMAYFADSPCLGDRVIDVSGDGKHNTSGEIPSLEMPGLRINALPILSDEPDLAEWYEKNIVMDGFLMPVERFEDFPRALRQKMAREIAEGSR